MHTREQYQQSLTQIEREPLRFREQHGLAEDERVASANNREFFSANVHRLLPARPMRTHPEMFEAVLMCKARADLDEDSFFLLEHTQIIDLAGVLDKLDTQPAIFATFHFGSYRLINMLLVQRGINYVLPVEANIYAEQAAQFAAGMEEGWRYFKRRTGFLLLNAEERISALTMARKVRAGWSLLAYVDGNTGALRGAIDQNKLAKVELLGNTLYARKGIAFLSHFLGLPIVPVFCEITADLGRRITFHAPIAPAPGVNRDEYCQTATQRLYTQLGEYLARTPEQWLGWLDMHKYLDLDAGAGAGARGLPEVDDPKADRIVRAEKLVFNHERFGFVQLGSNRMLLDKYTYEILSAPESVLAVLDACEDGVSSGALPHNSEEIIGQLLSLELLVPSL